MPLTGTCAGSDFRISGVSFPETYWSYTTATSLLEEHMRAIFRYYVVNLCDNTIVKSGATVSSEEDVRLDVGRLLTEEEYTLVKAGDLQIVTEFVADID
jgi:hypothetical protein